MHIFSYAYINKGTTLEDVLNVHISDTPLWSAKLLVEDPEVLIKAHLAFLEAGATVIQTATYVQPTTTTPAQLFDERSDINALSRLSTRQAMLAKKLCSSCVGLYSSLKRPDPAFWPLAPPQPHQISG
jgi:homocysteine S-methyltransferase